MQTGMESSPDPEFLNLHRLRCWLIAAEEGSISSAARRLGRPQPAVSQDISRLEAALGVVLFERCRSGIVLTSAGRALLPRARVALEAVEAAVRSVSDSDDLDSGKLFVATVSSAPGGYLAAAIGCWYERYGVALRFREFTHRDLAPAVAQGACDFGVGDKPVDWAGPIDDIGFRELGVILPRALRRTVTTDRMDLIFLRDESFVSYQPNLGLAALVRAACRASGFEPHIAIEVSQVEAAARLAEAGIGPALVPTTSVPPDLASNMVYLTRPPVWRVAAFSRSPFTKVSKAFIELAKATLPAIAPAEAVTISAD